MKTAMKAASSASTPGIPPLNLTRTGKVPAVLNGIPGQPKPAAATSEQSCAYCKQPATTGQDGAPYGACAECTVATTLRNITEARFEQATLDDGVKLVYKKAGTGLRVGYDPAQISPLDARLALNIFANYTEGEQRDGLRELGRNSEDTNTRELYNTILGKVDRTGDASGVIAQITRLFGQVRAEAGPVDPDRSLIKVTAPNSEELLIGAELYTSDDVQPHTSIAVWNHAGGAVDLDVAGTDQLIADLEEFIPRLRALRNHLAAEAGE